MPALIVRASYYGLSRPFLRLWAPRVNTRTPIRTRMTLYRPILPSPEEVRRWVGVVRREHPPYGTARSGRVRLR